VEGSSILNLIGPFHISCAVDWQGTDLQCPPSSHINSVKYAVFAAMHDQRSSFGSFSVHIL